MSERGSHDSPSLEEIIADSSGGELSLMLLLLLLVTALSILAIGWFARRRRGAEPSKPTWGFEVILAAFGLWILMQLVGGLLGIAVVGGSRVAIPPEEDPMVLIASLVGGGLFSLLFAAGLLKLPAWFGGEPDSLAFSGSMVRGLTTGACTFLLWLPGMISTTLIWASGLLLLGFDLEGEQQQVVQLFTSLSEKGSGALLSLLLLFAVGVAPFVEELLFRGLLFRWLAARFGVGAGILFSSLLFGAVHLEFSGDGLLFGALGPVAALGAVSAWLLHRNGNLWACIGLHATFNLAQLSMLLLN
ncbi:MAG TPA: CPBP family intramembrane metalloprotease [Planctomycetes bacterium]|nr:CPBP family intramembrane metalloprotease [Planctomycetota bacterium]HIN80176.1 CPBP family intramembrane metalloprotease [Planctomycetota bacterium]